MGRCHTSMSDAGTLTLARWRAILAHDAACQGAGACWAAQSEAP